MKKLIRLGTIIGATLNDKAKISAYILTIDFGRQLGVKTSSAQFTQNYSVTELLGNKVLAVINFPVKQVAIFKSEVLVALNELGINSSWVI